MQPTLMGEGLLRYFECEASCTDPVPKFPKDGFVCFIHLLTVR